MLETRNKRTQAVMLSAFLLLPLSVFAFIEDMTTAREHLEKKYNASEYIEDYYFASDEEEKKSSKPFELAVKRQLSKATRSYQALMKEYPNSPNIILDYAFFLTRRGRYSQAERVIDRATKKMPKTLSLKIVRDSLDKRKRYRRRKNRQAVMIEMDLLLAAWRSMVLEERGSQATAAKP